MFNDKKELAEEIQGIVEVKTMLSTTVKRYGEKLLQEGFHEGIQKGKLEGKLEGKHEKAIETARALLNKKMPFKEISEITGLPMEEIGKLVV